MKIIPILFITLVLFSMAGISQVFSEEEKDIEAEISGGSTLYSGTENNQITIRINNKISTDFSNVKAYLDLSYPFSVSSKDSNQFHIGNLTSSLVTAYFTVNVDGGAKYGTYTVPVRIVTNLGTFMDEVEIKVVGQTVLKVDSVTIDGESNAAVNPGDIFDLAVTLKNSGGNDIKNAKVTLNTNNDNIIPVSSSLSESFTNIRAGSYVRSIFNIAIDKNLTPRNQKMSLTLEFEDALGNKYTQNEEIGLRIVGQPKLEIGRITSNPSTLSPGTDFVLTLKIENIGTADADSVRLQLDSKFTGNPQAFLGRIEKNDYANGVFYLNAAQAMGNVPCKLLITYIDSQGEFKSEKEFNLSIGASGPPSSGGTSSTQTSSNSRPQQSGTPFVRPQSTSNIPIIPIAAVIIIIIAAIAGAFIYRKKKKSKKDITPPESKEQ
ncbi:MAG: hypothetical protein AMQ22_00856 [Candidatus Methanofastidiosum methylothiophilum]|uniref:CARDB domain-containing protein n=1 Tax=Candidatus Methanofastidiosum methylothiophilum TaxID=1705564 RepID=A0A150J557_9EURY|nr:MAG: hypothetical protein AMQ22_00856 [Candidatus Methanofastidiosum methylthiophilus]